MATNFYYNPQRSAILGRFSKSKYNVGSTPLRRFDPRAALPEPGPEPALPVPESTPALPTYDPYQDFGLMGDGEPAVQGDNASPLDPGSKYDEFGFERNVRLDIPQPTIDLFNQALQAERKKRAGFLPDWAKAFVAPFSPALFGKTVYDELATINKTKDIVADQYGVPKSQVNMLLSNQPSKITGTPDTKYTPGDTYTGPIGAQGLSIDKPEAIPIGGPEVSQGLSSDKTRGMPGDDPEASYTPGDTYTGPIGAQGLSIDKPEASYTPGDTYTGLGGPEVSKGLSSDSGYTPGDTYSGPEGGKDSGGSDDKVLCAEMYRQGYLPKAWYEADEAYAATVDREIIEGYQAWAIPYTKLMRKHKVFALIAYPLVMCWAKHMAFLMKAEDNDSRIGAFVEAIGVPICRKIYQIKTYINKGALTNEPGI